MNHRNDLQRRAVGRHDSHLQRPIKHVVFHEDGHQQLAAAGNGAVYIISRHSTRLHTIVALARTLQNDFKTCTYPAHFRSTTPPFASTTKLYLGARMLADARPVVLVWTADLQFSCLLQSNRRGPSDWEYTFLAQSFTGAVLYCGCSDGAIEVWNQSRDPGHARVYERALTGGHVGRICSLAVGQDGTLVSVDAERANVVRIWRSLIQVAKLDLGREKVLRMVCTPNKNLYVVTEAGSKLWCDLNRVLALVEPSAGLTNRPKPVFDLEYFYFLQEHSRGQTRAKSCRAVGGGSETVCFICFPTPGHDTFSVEEWRGGEFVSSVDTRLREFEAWTVSKHGTLYFSLRSTGH